MLPRLFTPRALPSIGLHRQSFPGRSSGAGSTADRARRATRDAFAKGKQPVRRIDKTRGQLPCFLNLCDAIDRLRHALATGALEQARDLALLVEAQSRLIARRLELEETACAEGEV